MPVPVAPCRVRLRALAALAGVLLSAAASAAPAAASERLSLAAGRQAPASGGIELVQEERLTARLTELTVLSPALGRETSLRVLLPSSAPPAGLPVLWLLHGGNDDYRSWTDKGAAERLTEGLPLIVVMPDSGPGGWYTDWRTATTSQGAQRWETLHVEELRSFIEERYRTRTDRAGHAVVGLSMGGYGALHYATRHPDLYGFTAGFSGSLDILHPGVSAVADLLSTGNGGKPGDIWGNRAAEESGWRAHNPVDLAANLRTVETQIRTGNGQPGGRHGGGPDAIEMGVYQSSSSLHNRLEELGIAHVWQDRGPGAHEWPYWQDDLRATLPRILAVAAEARPAPDTVAHTAFEPAYTAWGWQVDLNRPVLEMSRLTILPDAFTLIGTGRGTVRTPSRYRPGTAVTASVGRGDGERRTVRLTADGAGRVTVPVDLGDPSSRDQYPLSSPATAPPFEEVVVELQVSRVEQHPGPENDDMGVGGTVPVSGGTDARLASGGRLPATGGTRALAIVGLLVTTAAACLVRRDLGRTGRSDA